MALYVYIRHTASEIILILAISEVTWRMLHQLLGSLRKRQKEGLEDQGKVKELEGTPCLGVRRKPL